MVPKLKAAGKLAVTWQMSFLYAVTFGGFVAFSTYLPTYLKTIYDFSLTDAGARTAGFAVAAVIARPIGGVLSDRLHPKIVVMIVAGRCGGHGGGRLRCNRPRKSPPGASFIVLAFFLGIGTGGVFAWVARSAPPEQGRLGHRNRRCGRRSRWVLPAAGDGRHLRFGRQQLHHRPRPAGSLTCLLTLLYTAWRLPGRSATRTGSRRATGPSSGPATGKNDSMSAHPGTDGPVADLLLRSGRFFTRSEVSGDLRTISKSGGRQGDVFYRDRWSHDKVVRSTHGVNCTGSCSWKVYVKDGIITWETQETDYPTVGPDRPDYEPRGCPRGAAFSWYTYSPTRVRYPYARGVLVEMFREARARLGDPVLAWAEIQDDPERRRRYQQARGKGGLVRIGWDEAAEIAAAAHVHTIARYGPDRIAGFSPIPAMSMVSHAAGSRFIELLGGAMTSFYDWYADLPVASPQVFGDQTDVPESGDWWDASYLMMWGSNVPVTRTPDAHWMAEVRYRGTKVVSVSPDYSDNTKFADEWMPCAPGTDGAMAMAMGHVILSEFLVDKRTPFFVDYIQQYTDLPFLVRLDEHDGALRAREEPHRRRPGRHRGRRGVQTGAAGRPHRRGRRAERVARFPVHRLRRRQVEPRPGRDRSAAHGSRRSAGGAGTVTVKLTRFDTPDGHAEVLTRGVPVRRVGDQLCCTVFDLMLAQYGVARDGLPGDWPTGYDDDANPYTPAWQEPITGVSASQVIRIAREFAHNAEESGGRSMIIMGAGICQWFHGDATYRAVLAMLILTGSMGRNGGGWAHYVGQEKCRPITGWATMAMASDWVRPPRQMIGTGYWYAHTDQWRYDGYRADALTSPLGQGRFAGMHTMDVLASSVAMGWMPFFPQFDRNSLDLADEAAAAGVPDRRIRCAATGLGGAEARRHRPGRPGELAAGADRVAGQPARLVQQGQRVLPQAPARSDQDQPARRTRRHRAATQGRRLRPGGSRGEAGPDAVHRLPDDVDHAAVRPGAAGGHLVREVGSVLHRHAPVRARVQPGDRPAVGDPVGFRRVPHHRPRVRPDGRETPGRPPGRGDDAAAARHPRRDRVSRWGGAGLAAHR